MGKKKILVVDDDSLVAQTIDLCLRKRGYEVKSLYNGVDAVKYLFEEKPDSIILDIRLPDCDGWFIAKLLDKLDWGKEVPLIVISVLEPDQKRIAEASPHAYIHKPFDMEQLMQTVDTSVSSGSSSGEALSED